MTIVDPIRDDQGWAFRDPSGKLPPGARFESTDPVNGFKFLSEAYKATDPNFDQRVTVPVLWDKETKRIVNNCEDDICRMFNDVFNDFAENKDVDLFPKEIEAENAKLCDFLYNNVNNGVYKVGFATRQRPYEIACRKLFEALDQFAKAADMSAITILLDDAAQLALLHGDRLRSLRLAAAAASLQAKSGADVAMMANSLVGRPIAAATDAAERTAWDEGLAMSMDEAVAYALQRNS